MQYSIVRKSECSKYDFEYMLFSPEFFLQDKLACWKLLEKEHTYLVNDYFSHIKETVNEIDEKVICYDLTDGLPKFFDEGVEVSDIGSTKKIAKAGDFAISRLRSYLEEMGIVEDKKTKQLFSTEFLIFRPKTEKLSSHLLFALCMTKFVQTILKRGQYGTEHPRFYDFLLTHLPVPNCLLLLDQSIKQTIKQALSLRARSRETYKQAEGILLDEMELVDWRPKHCLSFVKNYSDTKRSGRMDADYFQPKYEEIIHAIQSYPDGYDTLGNLTNLKDRNYHPKHEQEYKYIELSNIGGNGEITGSMQEEGQNLPTRARRKVSAGDVIVSSVEGSLDSIAFIGTEYDNALCSTGFYVVNSKKMNSETLLVLMKSTIGQLQLKRGCSGTILTAIGKDETSNIVFPIIRRETQIEIRQRVTEAFALRRRSKHLLECAKRAVEIAIEQDEQTALAWLKSQAK